MLVYLLILLFISLNWQNFDESMRNKVLVFSVILTIIFILVNNYILSLDCKRDEPSKKIICNIDNDCGNKNFECKNNQCVLKEENKNKILDYLNAVYPNIQVSLNKLSDQEIYNFFINLGFYWVSYHNNVDNILKLIDVDFPSDVYCGGYFNRGGNELCGDDPSRHNADQNWYKNNAPTFPLNSSCCKQGTLVLPAPVGQLYYSDYLQRDIEVFRNGYDYKNLFENSVIFNPIYLYKKGKLDDPYKNLLNIKNGIDNTGKNISYKCCDGSLLYDFTSKGCGYSSNSLVEVSRDAAGGAPYAFYYITTGTGNFLNIGTNLRALNKIHALLLLIRQAGNTGFGSMTTYQFNGGNDYTKTKKQIILQDGKEINNSFVETPQLLCLELMLGRSGGSSKYTYSMNNPSDINGFGEEVAKKFAPNVEWPFSENGDGWGLHQSGKGVGYPHTYFEVDIMPILKWFFLAHNVSVPDFYDYKNNWKNWSYVQVIILGKFLDGVTVPYFKNWELNYCLNKIANSDATDACIFELCNQEKSEITGKTGGHMLKDVNGNKWDGVSFNGNFINTVSFCIQPSGSGNWAFELSDYRVSYTVANSLSDPTNYMLTYTEQFLKVGNPLNDEYKPCDPYFCQPDGTYCADGQKQVLKWKLFMCKSKN